MHELIECSGDEAIEGFAPSSILSLGFAALLTIVLLPVSPGLVPDAHAQHFVVATTTSGSWAAQDAPAPADPPEAPEAETSKVEDLYRELFTLRSRAARAERIAARDSLRLEIDKLQQRIEALHSERRRFRTLEGETRDEDFDVRWLELRREIERSAESDDVGEFNESLEEFLHGLGGVSEELGRHLGNIQLEISSERFRLGTDDGGYIDIAIPEDFQQQLSEGVGVFSEELGKVLSDSVLMEITSGIAVLADSNSQWSSAIREFLPRPPKPPARKKWRVVGRSMFKMGSDVAVAEDELVKGDVVVVFGNANIEGKVLGKAIAVFGDLAVAEGGLIEKDAVSVGGGVRMEQGGSVLGQVIDLENMLPGWAGGIRGAAPVFILVGLAIRVAVLALLLVLLCALMGDRIELMADQVRGAPGRSFLTGFVWLLGAILIFSLASVALAFSVIGIPIVVLLAMAFAGILLAAYFVACRIVGERVLVIMGRELSSAGWVSSLVGMLILELPAIILMVLSLPFDLGSGVTFAPRLVDLVFKTVALSVGFSAVVSSRFGGGLHGERRTPAIDPVPS